MKSNVTIQRFKEKYVTCLEKNLIRDRQAPEEAKTKPGDPNARRRIPDYLLPKTANHLTNQPSDC